ncbi:hypothetical protein [Mesorhizobium sp. 2RAF21]|uniref:hypothetical protein n=1 Tax=Mesorhizobium sp. 2RAF21 TaxID=3232995 RepID=UPI003F9C1997
MIDSDGEDARAFLDGLRRGDLSALLLHARFEIGKVQGDFGQRQAYVAVRAPQPFADAISTLSEHDRKRIAEAAVSRHDTQDEDGSPSDISVRATGDIMEGQVTLLPDLIIHREMMIDVSEGRKRIQEVDDYYGARQARLVEGCAGAGIKYENPHKSLWDWYHFWKEQGWGSWAERRDYVRKLFAGPVAAAVGRVHNPSPVAEREPTGWELVDRQIGKARMQFDRASAEEDWQGVGLTCREVLISLGQAAHDPEVHPTVDDKGTRISRTDARRLLDAWLHHEMPGGDNREVRAHIKASLDLAVHLQHRRTASRQLAALCLEATSSAVAVVAIMAGRTV